MQIEREDHMDVSSFDSDLLSELQKILDWKLGPYKGTHDRPDDRTLIHAWHALSEGDAEGPVWYGVNDQQLMHLQYLIRELLENTILPRHSRAFIERRLYSFLEGIATAKNRGEREEQLITFVEDFTAPLSKWTLIALVPKLRMELSEYFLGSLKFIVPTPQNLIREMPALKNWDEKVLRQKPEITAIALSVEANNDIDAISFGKERVERGLNTLGLYYQYWPHLVTQKWFICRGESDRASVHFSPMLSVDVFKDSIAQLRRGEDALERIATSFGPILEMEDKTLLARRFLRGLKWLQESRQEPEPVDRLIKLFAALEAFLSNTNHGIGEQIAKRATAVMEKTGGVNPAIDLQSDLIRLYRKRSKAVHGGIIFVESNELGIIDGTVTRLAWVLAEGIVNAGCSRLRDFLALKEIE